ncbi:MAG: hypothetical protein ABI042_00880 [Verrucomicrobiota bacterium]
MSVRVNYPLKPAAILWCATLILMGLGGLTANPLLTMAAIALLPVLVQLLWRTGEPPVLLFASLMQWVQATAGIFYSDLQHLPISTALESGEMTEKATWLSLLGVLVVTLAMRLALPHQRGKTALQAQRESVLLDVDRIFILWLIGFFFFALLRAVAFYVSALTQFIFAIASLEWALVFILAYAVLRNQKGYAKLVFVVSLEMAIGLMGFFSSFKTVFFVLLIALPTASVAITRVRLLQLGAIATVIIYLSVVWSSVKMEYRDFLNMGTERQVVLVPMEQRVEKLAELVGDLKSSNLAEGVDNLFLRASYVTFFAQVMENVPSSIPYENGRLWGGAIKHVLMPRFLFPNKATIEDSERTAFYTGRQVAGAEEGTSIGIGYFAESYIDFGPIGMFVPIFGLGLFYGWIYRFFALQQPVKVIGFSLATAILMLGASSIETSNIKLVGGNLSALLVLGLAAKFGRGWLWEMITYKGLSMKRERMAQAEGRSRDSKSAAGI